VIMVKCQRNKMSDKKDIEVFDQKTENVIEKTITGLVEGLTGVATSSKSDLLLSVSHTFQKMRGGQFLSVFLNEWNRYKKDCGTFLDILTSRIIYVIRDICHADQE